MTADAPQGSTPKSGAIVALGVAAVAAVVGFAAVYVTLGRPDNATPPPKSAPSPVSVNQPLPSGPGSNALSKGEMAAFVFRKEPEALPDFKFQDESGKERTLAHWRGKVVLLNLWATWCLPCRKEMPALDRLQKSLGSDKFEVVAISIDRKGMEASRKFLTETGVKNLALYLDATARLNSELRVVGLPATILIDAQGREVGRLLGPAEWDGEDAVRLIKSVVR
jgi:thiol-disulfide isomerase/thioredoxin